MNWDPEVRTWWLALSALGVMNITLWVLLYRKYGNRPWLWAGGLYVFGCAFRSFLPRADVQRFVMFDHFLSSVFVGRSVATVAELGFVAQWALVLSFAGKDSGKDDVVRIARVLFPLIFIAECFSWYAVLTTNYFGSVFEESLWGVTFILISWCVFSLRTVILPKWRPFLFASVAGLLSYVAYMFIVDVPMYYARWASDRAAGFAVVGVMDGVRDTLSHWRISRAFSDWRYEMLWMALYFSFGVWTSLLLNLIPSSWPRIRKS